MFLLFYLYLLQLKPLTTNLQIGDILLYLLYCSGFQPFFYLVTLSPHVEGTKHSNRKLMVYFVS